MTSATRKISTTYLPPTTDEFMALRAAVGWSNTDAQTTTRSIENSLFWLSIRSGEKLVATGRVVGDGAMYFYIQDVIVDPAHQGSGLGAKVMDEIEHYLSTVCVKGATVGLLSALGKEGFYRKYGYLLRDGKQLGMAMCQFI